MRERSLQERFEAYSELLIANNKSFNDMMKTIFQNGHWNSASFAAATGLDEQFFSRLLHSKREFSRPVLVSVCLGLGLDMDTSRQLLAANGTALSPTRLPDRAYLFLMEHGRDLPLEEKNEFLRSLEVREADLLGSKERQPR